MAIRTPIRLGTRGSPLARIQTDMVKERLMEAFEDLREPGAIEIVVISTTGDQIADRPLAAIGGKGLFCKEIEMALFDQRIDAGVHSMKDMPTWLPDGLVIAGMLERADPRDALICRKADSIRSLPAGAVVGTASLRRQAQILARRPDLTVINFRGSVGTRLEKLDAGEVDATLLARAGLDRLGLPDVPATTLQPEEMLPAVGQGVIGVECRGGDDDLLALFEKIDHAPSSQAVHAERAMLDVLDGSCHTPIGAYAVIGDGRLHLRGLVARADGSECFETERFGAPEDAVAIGRDAGQELRDRGGAELFE
ncbi:MAG: hydroxymethylbilane synthase [Alphaproteobacteria bacterium]